MRTAIVAIFTLALVAGASANLSKFTVNALKQIFPQGGSKATAFHPHLLKAMQSGGITNCPRIAAFLGQLGHESGQFRYMEELASGAAYEGRRDLGNTQAGDGRRFKGRGPIQITGRANYAAMSKALGYDFIKNPTAAASPDWGFKVAVWYWNTRGLSQLADQNNQGAYDKITRLINGGYNGKADRDQLWRKAKSVLGC
eukprot:TRINITY_DN5516_c0_g2_i3.p1 TRINITY_DN5516_c0_g2~~TRINITY_DN5516_c0_g2_i3.p1  ORF type:complete len:199 (-),score=64.97 TRINITY_DN5516_c0_g2_i3:139-735(-)